MSAARLNVGFSYVRGCYDWRVDLELGLHVFTSLEIMVRIEGEK